MIKHYVIIKDNKDDILYLKYQKLEGFKFRPLNNLDYKHGVKVTTMTLYKPELIELILKKKIKNKLVEYLNLILEDATDEGSTDDAGYVRAVLSDVTRYRQMIINKYRRYLEEKYVELLLEKISIIEEELKNKLVYLIYKDEEKENEVEKETRRRR